MTLLTLDIPEYADASISFITEVMQGLLKLDPLFKGIPLETSIHRGPIRNVQGDSPLDQEMFPVQGTAIISWDTVRNSNIEDFICFLVTLSDSNRESLARQLFKHMAEVTDASGTSINAGGKPLSSDMILDLLEKVDFDFDEQGNPQFPTFVLPPTAYDKFKKLKLTPEQEKRQERIIEEKRAKFNAKKRTRRLS